MSTNASQLATSDVAGSNPSKSKNLFPQTKGEICLNDNFQWVLDGVELVSRSKIKIQIGGHWIIGSIVKVDSNSYYWSSWAEGVGVPINFGIKARWLSDIEKARL